MDNSKYYGGNTTFSNRIMIDSSTANNPYGLMPGVPGPGKNFSIKREIVNALVKQPNHSILILDLEREYAALIEALDGKVVKP